MPLYAEDGRAGVSVSAYHIFSAAATGGRRSGQILFQVLAGVRGLAGRHCLRSTGADEGPSPGAALRAQIDEPVGGLDDIQIVLDDQHRVPGVHQPLQHLQQLLHIVGVQTRGGLVQNIEGAARGTAGQLRGQLHPLGLAAGEGGGGLAQLHIAQSHIAEGPKLFGDPRHRGKKGQRLLRRHIQHVSDALALVLPVFPGYNVYRDKPHKAHIHQEENSFQSSYNHFPYMLHNAHLQH